VVQSRTGSLFLTHRAWAIFTGIVFVGISILLLHRTFRDSGNSIPATGSHADSTRQSNNASAESMIVEPNAATARISSDEISNVTPPQATVEYATIPLVLYQPAPDIDWSDEQIQKFNTLRDLFVAALGREKDKPADPAYWDHWLEAQSWADDQFETAFGIEVLNRQKIYALRHSK
jgi:hypothetical protein